MNASPKIENLRLALGQNIQNFRIKVLREDPAAFALRLSKMAPGAELAEADIHSLENALPGASLEALLRSLVLMQVADAVADASKASAAIYIASAALDPGIEQEMIEHLNKRGGNG